MNGIDEATAEPLRMGAPRKRLDEVGQFIRGRRFTKADYVAEGLGSIHYGEVYKDYGTTAVHVNRFVRERMRDSLRLAQKGDLVIAATGETVADLGKAVAWLGDDEVAVHDDCYIYRHNLDPQFASYLFQSRDFHHQKAQLATEAKLARISGANLGKIMVPVPSLPAQREIASTIGEIESLEAGLEVELEAERDARSRQYAFYRDQLLTFSRESNVRWVPLGELAGEGFFRDGDWVESKDQDPTGDVRLTQLADVGVDAFRNRSDRWMRRDQAARLSCTFLEPGDVLIARMPDPLGRACQVPNSIGRAVTVVDVAILRCQAPGVLPRYVMYAINSGAIRRRIESFGAGSTRQRITRRNLETVLIPIPPRDEQERIVTTLDKLDSLVSDLSIALPDELAGRRKQYEHYRDKLLASEGVA